MPFDCLLLSQLWLFPSNFVFCLPNFVFCSSITAVSLYRLVNLSATKLIVPRCSMDCQRHFRRTLVVFHCIWLWSRLRCLPYDDLWGHIWEKFHWITLWSRLRWPPNGRLPYDDLWGHIEDTQWRKVLHSKDQTQMSSLRVRWENYGLPDIFYCSPNIIDHRSLQPTTTTTDNNKTTILFLQMKLNTSPEFMQL